MAAMGTPKVVALLFFKTIVSCRELWLWGETVGTSVAALKMAVNGVFEDFYALLTCAFIRNEGVLQNIFPDVLICVLEPLLAGPPIRLLSIGLLLGNPKP